MSDGDRRKEGDGVSRETAAASAVPATPVVAGTLFPGPRLDLVRRFAALLATDGVTRGLIGPREAPRLWERHLLNCAVLAEVIPQNATVCDVGSGAGLPGVVLGLARPDLYVTLLEPLLRRTTFLAEVVAELELDSVEVVRGRAEELHGRRTFDVVTSRAVAPLGRLLRWSMPLVARDGVLLAMKGSSARTEVDAAADVIHSLGLTVPDVLAVGQDVLAEPSGVVRVAWADPRQVGLPTGSDAAAATARRRSEGRRPGRSGHRSPGRGR